MSPSGKPVLWHIGVSHYSEKVRWALDYKGVEHERREPTPGVHMALALWWSKGETKTFPVLDLDGEKILDSTAIIGALEAKWPEPPLYPEDPSDRRQALDLEDYFDENLGPAVRLFGWHHLRQDKEMMQKRGRDKPSRAGPRLRAGAQRRERLRLRLTRTSASRLRIRPTSRKPAG